MPIRSLLVVDDDVDLCRIMEAFCKILDEVECVTAISLTHLQEQIGKALRTDLALLDVMLGPDQPSGIEIYRWLKAQGYSQKVIFFSGHARTDPAIAEALKIPGVEFLEKPVEMERLEELILGRP